MNLKDKITFLEQILEHHKEGYDNRIPGVVMYLTVDVLHFINNLGYDTYTLKQIMNSLNVDHKYLFSFSQNLNTVEVDCSRILRIIKELQGKSFEKKRF